MLDDVAVSLEAVECFAHRGATALVTLCKVLFDEALAKWDFPEKEVVAKVLVDALGNRVRAAHGFRTSLLE
jgi:hypothetical protein